MREDKIRYIGQEIVDGVPLGGMETTALMDPSPSPSEEKLAKKRAVQHIVCGIKTTEMES